MKKAVAVILAFLCVIPLAVPFSVLASNGSRYESFSEIAEGIIEWKTESLSEDDSHLFVKLSRYVGSTAGDWYAFSLGRLSHIEYSSVYADHLKLYTEQKYGTDEKLSSYLSTEWHRISLTALALGEDPTCFGKDKDGKNIDLISDGTYGRELTEFLGKQGINGYIWALITLDSMRYEIPDNALTDREDIIKAILELQLADGGFALSGKYSDPDVTSMALVALSPYINDLTAYSYTQKATLEKREALIRDVIDEAVSALARMQTDDGEFRSYGSKNVKSACQVTVALCSVGIDIFTDERFIKDGSTLFDVIKRYQNSDGGFSNLSGDSTSDSMSGEQVLYTMSALMRFEGGERKLFDMRDDFSDGMKERLYAINKDIKCLSESSSSEEIEALYRRYCALPIDERDYIYSYHTLLGYAKTHRLDIEKIDAETKKEPDSIQTPPPSETEKNLLSEEDVEFIISLSDTEDLTTEFYDRILILQKKNALTEPSAQKDKYTDILDKAIAHIEVLLSDIEKLNGYIAENAHPLEDVDSSKREFLRSLVQMYEQLSEYDKTLVEDAEGLYSAYAKASSDERADTVFILSVGGMILLSAFVVLNIRRRRKKKKMSEEICEE